MQILVVDDSEISRYAIREALEKGGYQVEEAGSGHEAIEFLKTNRPSLVTLDITLPDMDGFEVCQRLRSMEYHNKLDELPVVFVTADDTLEGRVMGFEVGAADFLTKTSFHEEILDAVNRVLAPDSELAGTKALVIEDSDISRALVRQHLKEQGVEVLEAKGGDTGITLLTEHRDEIDLIITDVRMPNMGGAEVCRHARKTLGLTTIPIIVLSVVENLGSILDVFKMGATDYIIKPYIKEELFARLNSHLRVRLLNRNLQRRFQELESARLSRESLIAACAGRIKPAAADLMGSLQEIARLHGESDQAGAAMAYAQELLRILDDVVDK